MGCCFSSDADAAGATAPSSTAAGATRREGASAASAAAPVRAAGAFAKEKPTKKYGKPLWRAAQGGISSKQQLERARDEFWTTAPAYGGAAEAWQALRAAAESPDFETTRLIIEAAGLIVARPDMTVVYDERGARYELPCYALSDPEDGPLPDAAAVAAAATDAEAGAADGQGAAAVELAARS